MDAYHGAISKLQALDVLVKRPVRLADVTELTVNGEQAIMPIACECLTTLSAMPHVVETLC